MTQTRARSRASPEVERNAICAWSSAQSGRVSNDAGDRVRFADPTQTSPARWYATRPSRPHEGLEPGRNLFTPRPSGEIVQIQMPPRVKAIRLPPGLQLGSSS